MAELVLARQPLQQLQVPADQIEIGCQEGEFCDDLAAGNALEELQNRRRLRRHPGTVNNLRPWDIGKSQQPTSQKPMSRTPCVRKDDTHLIRTSEADDLINLAELEDRIHEKGTRYHPLSEQT
jgi:hypothetical protein